MEKGNIISRATVLGLFSNWKSLLGINQELLRQLEECQNLNNNKQQLDDSNTILTEDSKPSHLVRVTFVKEQASKTIAVSTADSGRAVINIAVKKVSQSLPNAEQECFRERYAHCEMYDDKGTYSLNQSFIEQLPHHFSSTETPHVFIRKAQKAPTNVGECFLQMVILFSTWNSTFFNYLFYFNNIFFRQLI